MIRSGSFREDLWFRLNVFPITIPPLRHRLMDIPALVNFFIERKKHELNFYAERKVNPDSIEALQAYHWPGNVRELENVVERALIRSTASREDTYLRFDDLNLSPLTTETVHQAAQQPQSPSVLNIDDAMRNHIESVLELTNGQIGGADGAAVLLGLAPSTLRNRMIKLGILQSRSTKNQKH